MTNSSSMLTPRKIVIDFARGPLAANEIIQVHIDKTGIEVFCYRGESTSFWMVHSDLQMIAAISAQVKSWHNA